MATAKKKPAAKSTKATKKAPAKTSGMHKEVHDMWGWVVLVIGLVAIAGIACYYLVTLPA